MISDGFGDDLSPSEVAQAFQKYAHKIAYDSAGREIHDDLVQEALIAVWKAAQRKPDASAVYFAKVLRTRVKDVAWRGTPFTGGDSKPGPKSRPTENGVDWQDPETQDIYGSLLSAADALSAVEWAYHHGEILEALRSLPEADQEYVVRRFWHGQTDTEIAAIKGVSNKFLGGRWKKQIKPKLEAALAHLAP